MPITTTGYHLICYHSINKHEQELIFMIPITENEENKLDSGHLSVFLEGKLYTITSSEIICYGKIDLNTNSDDYHTIENMKWLDYLQALGIPVPSDYNYKEHACYPPTRKLRYYDTTNPAVVAQYVHGRLGKPERCCIFKHKRYV